MVRFREVETKFGTYQCIGFGPLRRPQGVLLLFFQRIKTRKEDGSAGNSELGEGCRCHRQRGCRRLSVTRGHAYHVL